MLEKNIDTVVLGCTHYPFVIRLIENIVGENVRVIDPAPAVAKQTERLLEARGLRNSSNENGEVIFFTSGDVKSTKNVLSKLIREKAEITPVTWKNDWEIAHSYDDLSLRQTG
jgi:glutamate racemase